MKSLAILGAGGHGKVVADAALCSGWTEISFFDDRWPSLEQVSVWKVAGSIDAFFTGVSCFDGVIIAIGDNSKRLAMIERVLTKSHTPLVSIIHPSAIISRFATVESGTAIFAGAVINPDSKIGIGSIINTSATVDHDCNLGKAIHISPGANLAGGVHIGDLTWIGIGSSIRQQIVIGANVTVGAGAVVVKNIPDHCMAVGVPAEIIENKAR
ncbi:acetyltransferase [Legionella hackeliae]|uniref:Trimeric LpxA-like family protein n=1 Tax=Legionella hackeliae TaxID=449 RepID=A0A0A8UMZ3_LEGHA|nr:acetyltransferase [Legionella hackeliae]KTD08817.1 chloramphenicol acetyltransferase [Legionella hackeliae]CEK10245.1 Trimeric LpxA-like family protein [Legionella hackeliae]STX46974.1 acetyltransferase [Legionella hackeliae]